MAQRGAGGGIAPNSTLIFEVELVSIKSSAAAQPGRQLPRLAQNLAQLIRQLRRRIQPRIRASNAIQEQVNRWSASLLDRKPEAIFFRRAVDLRSC